MKANVFTFDEITSSSGLEVIVPKGIDSKEVLLEKLGIGLHFPNYYGKNWDALEECLRDLSWIDEQEVLIRHYDIPLGNYHSMAKTYLSILASAAQKWKHEGSHELKIFFPMEFEKKIEFFLE